jgi:uncharacterized protein YutD
MEMAVSIARGLFDLVLVISGLWALTGFMSGFVGILFVFAYIVLVWLDEYNLNQFLKDDKKENE